MDYPRWIGAQKEEKETQLAPGIPAKNKTFLFVEGGYLRRQDDITVLALSLPGSPCRSSNDPATGRTRPACSRNSFCSIGARTSVAWYGAPTGRSTPRSCWDAPTDHGQQLRGSLVMKQLRLDIKTTGVQFDCGSLEIHRKFGRLYIRYDDSYERLAAKLLQDSPTGSGESGAYKAYVYSHLLLASTGTFKSRGMQRDPEYDT